MSGTPYILTLAAALGCGLNAGALFAFSSFVMVGLRQLPSNRGIAAMQSINITAVSPVFMTAFFGTALLCLGIAGWALFSSENQPTSLLVSGSVLYLAGTIVTTIAGNVPMNNRLAKLDPDRPESVDYWTHYLNRWTQLNHIRVLAALLATTLFVLALAG